MRASLKIALFASLLIAFAAGFSSWLLWQPLQKLQQQQTRLQAEQLWEQVARLVRKAHPAFSNRPAVQKRNREILTQIKQSLHKDVVLWKAPGMVITTLLPPQESALTEQLRISGNPRNVVKLPDLPNSFVFKPLFAKQKVWLGLEATRSSAGFGSLLLKIAIVTLLLIFIAIIGIGRHMYNMVQPLKQAVAELEAGDEEGAVPEPGTDSLNNMDRLISQILDLAARLRLQLEAGKIREAELRRNLKESQNKMVRLTDNLERAVARRASQVREKDAQLLQSGKLAGLGQLSTGIAHEINQPLNVIKLTVTGLLRQYSRQRNLETEEVVEELKIINQQTVRVQKIIEHMKAFARKRVKQEYDEIDINTPVRESLLLIGQQLKAHQIELNLQLDTQLPKVKADPYQVEQILVNLINNARDALDEKVRMLSESARTTFHKEIDIRTFSEEGKVVLWVRDNGKGMSEQVQRQIFEPFFSTKNEKKGTGLGMSITYNLAKNMNAEISLESKEGEFTVFSVRFPAAG